MKLIPGYKYYLLQYLIIDRNATGMSDAANTPTDSAVTVSQGCESCKTVRQHKPACPRANLWQRRNKEAKGTE